MPPNVSPQHARISPAANAEFGVGWAYDSSPGEQAELMASPVTLYTSKPIHYRLRLAAGKIVAIRVKPTATVGEWLPMQTRRGNSVCSG